MELWLLEELEQKKEDVGLNLPFQTNVILKVENFKHNIHVKYGLVDLLIFDILYNVCYNFNLGIWLRFKA
jgi:hypothetical protein